MTTDINSILNSASSAYSQQQSAKTSGSDLTQSDFLRLMATQLRSQDPSQPMDPSSFFNQLTQFSLVSGMQGPKARMLDRLSLGMLRHHLTKQYIMLGEPVERDIQQQPVKWMLAD